MLLDYCFAALDYAMAIILPDVDADGAAMPPLILLFFELLLLRRAVTLYVDFFFSADILAILRCASAIAFALLLLAAMRDAFSPRAFYAMPLPFTLMLLPRHTLPPYAAFTLFSH